MGENRRRILVVNPNSNQDVTDGLAQSVSPLEVEGGPAFECHTLTEGPFGIENQAHINAVVAPLLKLFSSRTDVDAFVIACYADPGLAACREAVQKPVFGICESGVLSALSRGDTFGVLSVSQRSIQRHEKYLRSMGVADRFAGGYPLNMSVAETATLEAFPRMVEAGKSLRDEKNVSVLIMGCAGMARHSRHLQDELGIPVIDPTFAAATMAFGVVQNGS